MPKKKCKPYRFPVFCKLKDVHHCDGCLYLRSDSHGTNCHDGLGKGRFSMIHLDPKPTLQNLEDGWPGWMRPDSCKRKHGVESKAGALFQARVTERE